MDEKSFCYWLQGFFEISEADKLSEKQVLMIKEHLKLVFKKVTPEPSQTPQTPPVLNIPVWDYPQPGEPRFCSAYNARSLDTNTIGFK